MKKQPELTDSTRTAFLQAFCDCYAEKPLEKITVKEIPEKAGYSRVTFYNYFRDSYDLLNYMEDDFIAYITREILTNVEQDKNLGNFIFTFTKALKEQNLYSQIFLCDPQHSSLFTSHLKPKLLPLFLQAFGIPSDHQKAVYAFEFYIPGVISVISHWIQRPESLSIEELAELVEGILKEGVLSQLK